MPSFLALVALLLSAVPLACLQARTFTNDKGRKIEASIVEVNEKKVTLDVGGTNFEVLISTLSPADREHIKQWSKKGSAGKPKGSAGKPTAKTLGDFEGLVSGSWPTIIAGSEGKDFEIVENDDGSYTYQSKHFEFHIKERLSLSVVREFSRIFEATYEFLNQAPFGLSPSPAGGSSFYQTKLFLSRNAYLENGGPANSGGVFTYSYRRGATPAEIKFNKALIKIPMDSLGVSHTGTRFIIDHDKQNSTLIHEITHQVMMRWLPVMPTWMVEGFAEFVESQDYSKGRYKTRDPAKAVKESVLGSSKEFKMASLERLMSLTSRQWSEELGQNLSSARNNYRSSNVLLGYFAMLDDEGKNLVEYLKLVSQGTPEKAAVEQALLRGRSYDELETDVIDAWRKKGLRLSFKEN